MELNLFFLFIMKSAEKSYSNAGIKYGQNGKTSESQIEYKLFGIMISYLVIGLTENGIRRLIRL